MTKTSMLGGCVLVVCCFQRHNIGTCPVNHDKSLSTFQYIRTNTNTYSHENAQLKVKKDFIHLDNESLF